jgi:hypothetical protein
MNSNIDYGVIWLPAYPLLHGSYEMQQQFFEVAGRVDKAKSMILPTQAIYITEIQCSLFYFPQIKGIQNFWDVWEANHHWGLGIFPTPICGVVATVLDPPDKYLKNYKDMKDEVIKLQKQHWLSIIQTVQLLNVPVISVILTNNQQPTDPSILVDYSQTKLSYTTIINIRATPDLSQSLEPILNDIIQNRSG